MGFDTWVFAQLGAFEPRRQELRPSQKVTCVFSLGNRQIPRTHTVPSFNTFTHRVASPGGSDLSDLEKNSGQNDHDDDLFDDHQIPQHRSFIHSVAFRDLGTVKRMPHDATTTDSQPEYGVMRQMYHIRFCAI